MKDKPHWREQWEDSDELWFHGGQFVVSHPEVAHEIIIGIHTVEGIDGVESNTEYTNVKFLAGRIADLLNKYGAEAAIVPAKETK